MWRRVLARPPRTALLVAAATALGIILLCPAVRFFLDLPSFLITVGGTALVTLVSFPVPELSRTARLVAEAIRSPRPRLDEIVVQVRRLATLYRREGVKRLEAEEGALPDPFMRLAVAKVADWKGEGEIVECLAGELVGFQWEIEAAGRVLQTVGRLLPAFGLIGTLISLVLLLRATAVPDPRAMAPALSLAILTTLYGALLANAIVLPLATKVENRGETRLIEMSMIAEGAVMMARNERPAVIGERLGAIARAIESNRAGTLSGPPLIAAEQRSATSAGWPAIDFPFLQWSGRASRPRLAGAALGADPAAAAPGPGARLERHSKAA